MQSASNPCQYWGYFGDQYSQQFGYTYLSSLSWAVSKQYALDGWHCWRYSMVCPKKPYCLNFFKSSNAALLTSFFHFFPSSAIPPNYNLTYEINITQHGTYWIHSHYMVGKNAILKV